MASPQHHTIKLIDLFAGAGGLTRGFIDGLGAAEVVWANDFNTDAVKTYKANFGDHCLAGDIVSILKNPKTVVPKADLVIGGPPCQGFSLLNKKRDGDPRKQLWRPFLEIVERSGASVFVMENVIQLLASDEHKEITEEAERMGFQITSGKLCAADYGVPQVRWRAFIVGCKFADPRSVFPPRRTHHNPKTSDINIDHLKPWATVRDAIEDLPPPEGVDFRYDEPPLDLHFGRNPTPMSMKRYRAIPKEGMNRFDLQKRAPELTPQCWIRKTSGGTDLFGRLWWDRPAFTIRTEFYKPEKGRYLHPVQHRPITLREAARFQTFPDDFIFKGTKIEVARQIGNAVPVKLAQAVARCVSKLFAQKEKEDGRQAVSRATKPFNVACEEQEYRARKGRKKPAARARAKVSAAPKRSSRKS